MNTELKNTTDTLQDYLSYIQDDIQVKKIRTGFDKLDNLLNGGLPNGLIILGAIPSLGKTTFALQVADNMASMENTKVLLFSLEMTKFDIISKSLSRLSYLADDLNNGANEREYEAKRNPRKITLSVIKNRYGALGRVNFDFYTMYHTFLENNKVVFGRGNGCL